MSPTYQFGQELDVHLCYLESSALAIDLPHYPGSPWYCWALFQFGIILSSLGTMLGVWLKTSKALNCSFFVFQLTNFKTEQMEADKLQRDKIAQMNKQHSSVVHNLQVCQCLIPTPVNHSQAKCLGLSIIIPLSLIRLILVILAKEQGSAEADSGPI